MTSQQIRNMIEKHEYDTNNAFSALCKEAHNMGTSTVDTANQTTTLYTWLCLIGLVGVGFLLIASGFIGWGFVFIIGGCIISYNVNQSHSSLATKIESEQKQLENVLKNNNKI